METWILSALNLKVKGEIMPLHYLKCNHTHLITVSSTLRGQKRKHCCIIFDFAEEIKK
jgi:hypothetical protein